MDYLLFFFFKDYLEGIFLDYANYVSPLAKCQAKITCFSLCHVKSMNARCFTYLWSP